jgi:hypothetical protein
VRFMLNPKRTESNDGKLMHDIQQLARTDPKWGQAAAGFGQQF